MKFNIKLYVKNEHLCDFVSFGLLHIIRYILNACMASVILMLSENYFLILSFDR